MLKAESTNIVKKFSSVKQSKEKKLEANKCKEQQRSHIEEYMTNS